MFGIKKAITSSFDDEIITKINCFQDKEPLIKIKANINSRDHD
jgi:hypothetical protein